MTKIVVTKEFTETHIIIIDVNEEDPDLAGEMAGELAFDISDDDWECIDYQGQGYEIHLLDEYKSMVVGSVEKRYGPAIRFEETHEEVFDYNPNREEEE